MTQMKASQALVRELSQWGIERVYGIPADALIDGFAAEQDKVDYIQVRHEEVAAVAAAASAKLTGKISVAMASVGPGATHLLNGLYDAKMDHTPMLVIVSQVPTAMINTHFVQDMDENELFASLDTFHVQVADARQIPATIREAIETAYATQSPSIVMIPDDLPQVEIDYEPVVKKAAQQAILNVDEVDVAKTRELLAEAKRPLLFVGTGIKNAREEVMTLSTQYGLPIACSAPAVGLVPSDFKNYLGSMGQIGTAPAYEAVQLADLVLMVGTQYPFARFFPKNVKTIQINNRLADLGNQVNAVQLVQADAASYLRQLNDLQATPRPISPYLNAARQARVNWDNYLEKRASQTATSLTPEAVMAGINDISDPDAVYGVDIGNNTVWSLRQLRFDADQKMTMSAWFGTMGYALSTGIAAQLDYPDRQVITVSGDGGFSMVVQDLLTQVQYQLPVINVVLENGGYGYIQQEKKRAGETNYGLTFENANWAGVAEQMGAVGLRATDGASLHAALDQIVALREANDSRPIVLDAVIESELPVDTSWLAIDPNKYSEEKIQEYRARYNFPESLYPSMASLLDAQ